MKNNSSSSSSLISEDKHTHTEKMSKLDLMSREDMMQLLHELEVHQIELEMQNDELRNMQLKLDESRIRYFDLYHKSPIGYCSVTESGAIIEANLTASNMLDVFRNELITHDFTHYICRESQDIFYHYKKKLFNSSGAPVSCELQMKKSDGSEFWAYLVGSLVENIGEEIKLHIAINDINERKEMENELILKDKRLIQLLQDNKNFIYDTVHQVKTPLSVIMLNSDLLRMCQADESTLKFTDQISSSINMLSNAFEDLSYITSHDTIEYPSVKICISDIVDERIKFFETISQVNEKTIRSNIQKDIYFNINYTELERLIDNNISNAIKYAEVNKPITVALQMRNSSMALSFYSYADPIQNPSKVFERGYREKEEERGLGLGLSMVKGICEKYHIRHELAYENDQNIFVYTFQPSDSLSQTDE